MAKTEVYSWRISPETKNDLELEARKEGESMATLLERIARDWLEARRRTSVADEAEQARLHAGVRKAFGSIAGGDRHRAEHARLLVRQRLWSRRDR